VKSERDRVLVVIRSFVSSVKGARDPVTGTYNGRLCVYILVIELVSRGTYGNGRQNLYLYNSHSISAADL